jgi:hypothetical protein
MREQKKRESRKQEKNGEKKKDKNTAVLKENAREAGDGETSYLPAYS